MFNQNFKAEPAWTISSEHRESGPGIFQTSTVARHWQILSEKNLQKYICQAVLESFKIGTTL